MTHTPTPWIKGQPGNYRIYGPGQLGKQSGPIMETMFLNDRQIQADNRDRANACVNFFHGQPIPTERIPEGGFWEMAEALYNSNSLLGTLATLDDEVTIAAMKINRQLLAKLGVEP